MREMKALRNRNHEALRNGVTNVTAKRPDTETYRITTTVGEERKGLSGEREGRSSIPVSSELVAINARFKQ
jgi:hypothetical protein